MKRGLPKLTYANVVATIALIIAVGGGAAIAANSLPKNSVKSKQIAKEAVKTSKLAKDAATGAKVKESTLGKVPLAAHADTADTAASATNAAHANVADALGGSGGSAPISPESVVQTKNIASKFSSPLELNIKGWGRFWLSCKSGEVVAFNYSSTQGPKAFESGIIVANEFPLDLPPDIFPISSYTSDAGSVEFGTQGRRLYVHYTSAILGTGKTLEIDGGGQDEEGSGCVGQLHASISG